MDMKTSTSSVITTSDVSTKDRSSLTDRLTSITDEGDIEYVLYLVVCWELLALSRVDIIRYWLLHLGLKISCRDESVIFFSVSNLPPLSTKLNMTAKLEDVTGDDDDDDDDDDAMSCCFQ
jgi:hypothetical protein